jgi:hypothetical protein
MSQNKKPSNFERGTRLYVDGTDAIPYVDAVSRKTNKGELDRAFAAERSQQGSTTLPKRQSEYKKPYTEDDYQSMEYHLTGTNKPIDTFKPDDLPTQPDTDSSINNCLGCWNGPDIDFCPGETVRGEMVQPCASDKITSMVVNGGYGSLTWKGPNFVYQSSSRDNKFSIVIEATTKSGSHCSSTLHPNTDCESCDCGSVSIGYTTNQMNGGEEQSLTAVGGGSGCSFTWSLSGGGSVFPSSGASTTYTAPVSNPDCANNPVVSLKCKGVSVGTLPIAVNTYVGGDPAVRTWSGKRCWFPGGTPGSLINCGLTNITYHCDGTIDFGPCEVVAQYNNYPNNATCDQCTGMIIPSPACFSGNGPMDYLESITPIDLRTTSMKNGGCCPSSLL